MSDSPQRPAPETANAAPQRRTDELICACTDLRLGEYRRLLQANPNLSFDDVLAQTGAGGACTACLLDLEYFYVSTPRDAAPDAKGITTNRKPKRSLKRRIFDFIDSISPPVPYTLPARLPVIAGAGLVQNVWVSNRSLMFEGETSAPPFKVMVTVRDAAGEVRHRETHTVEPEDALMLTVSAFIAPPADATLPLAVGSVEITRRGTRRGFRGTTRPQTEILARDGACSVHAQNYKIPGERWFSFAHQPQDQRVFLSFINFAGRPNTVSLSYPMNAEDIGIAPRRFDITLPAHGATLHEIDINAAKADALSGRHLTLKWTCSSEYNCHIFCATPDLGRFSIDHS